MTREDVELLRALEPTQAREMENLLLAQSRADRQYRHFNVSLDLDELERTVGAIDASMFSTGGGRKIAGELPGS